MVEKESILYRMMHTVGDQSQQQQEQLYLQQKNYNERIYPVEGAIG